MMKFHIKMSEKNREKTQKFLNVARITKNAVCWTLIAVLTFTVGFFLVTRINGGTPSLFGYTIQRVSSGSMEPTLKVGDIILSKDIKDVSALKVGDIITFQGGKQYEFNRVTHRVIVAPYKGSDDTYCLVTKGDANDSDDGEIKGNAVRSIFIQKVDFLEKFYTFFLSPWGFIIFIGLILLIFFDEVVNIVRIITGNLDDEEEEESISQIIERIKREDAEKERLEEENSKISQKKKKSGQKNHKGNKKAKNHSKPKSNNQKNAKNDSKKIVAQHSSQKQNKKRKKRRK